MTQPQLEASAGEAGGGGVGGCSQWLGPALAVGPRDGPRLSPARAAASSQAGAGQAWGGAALYNHLRNTSPSWSTPSPAACVRPRSWEQGRKSVR